MRKLNVKSIFFSCLFIHVGICAEKQSIFKDIFDESIYDQSTIRRVYQARGIDSKNFEDIRSLNDTELRKAMLSSLYTQKISCLEKKLFQKLDTELQDIKLLMENHKTSTPGKILKVIGSVLSGATSLALIGVVPSVGGARVAMGAAGAAGMAGTGLSSINEFLQPSGHLDLDKIHAELERKKREYIMQLAHEPVGDFEVNYVLKKRFFSPELQKQIERVLISMRSDAGLPYEFKVNFIEHCLSLPLEKRRIEINPIYWDLDKRDVPQEFLALLSPEQLEARRKLALYPPEIKKELQQIIIQVIFASHSHVPTHKRFFYFFGSPGFGKSTAAKLLATYLGVPSFETNIRTADDLRQSALEGGDWQRQFDATPGHIARTLMNGCHVDKDKFQVLKIVVPSASKYGLNREIQMRIQTRWAKQSFIDSFLIINDFDRLLLDQNTSTQTLAFFLDYLDPAKEMYFSPYFQSFIEVMGLFIFVTGNHELPKEERYAALRDRLTPIEFKPFSFEHHGEILLPFFEQASTKYRLHIDEETKRKMMEQTKSVESIRKSKNVIEGNLLDLRMRDKAFTKPADKKESYVKFDGAALGYGYGELSYEIHPPRITDLTLLKDLKSCEETNQTASQITSLRQIEQLEGVRKLLGTPHKFKSDEKGLLQNLWKTGGFRPKHKESDGKLNALANRMERFTVPQQKDEVMTYHINLLQFIAYALLKLKNDEFLCENIMSSPLRTGNIRTFAEHLYEMSLLSENPTVFHHKLGAKSLSELKNYASWLGKGSKSNKAELLLQLYCQKAAKIEHAELNSLNLDDVNVELDEHSEKYTLIEKPLIEKK